MKKKMRVITAFMLFAAAMPLVGCAGETDTEEEEEDVAEDESALVALEYKETTLNMTCDGTRCYPQLTSLLPRANAEWGWGGYETTGDKIWIRDTASDGRSVGVHWKVLRENGSVYRRGICRNLSGRNTITKGCDYDFPEGMRIAVRLGRCDGTVYSCRTLTGWTNWTAWHAGGT